MIGLNETFWPCETIVERAMRVIGCTRREAIDSLSHLEALIRLYLNLSRWTSLAKWQQHADVRELGALIPRLPKSLQRKVLEHPALPVSWRAKAEKSQ